MQILTKHIPAGEHHNQPGGLCGHCKNGPATKL